MGVRNAAKARMLDALAGNTVSGSPITHASLHTAYPASSGNELTGGSPAYARKALTFEAVAGTELAGSLDVSNAPVFDVPAGSSVAAIGFWTAITAGTIMADSAAGGGALKPFNVDAALVTTDVIDAKAHGFTDTQTVLTLGSTLPGGLVEGTVYYVRDSTTDTLKLTLTSGGTAVDITSIGFGNLQRIVVETFNGQGQYTLSDADISL